MTQSTQDDAFREIQLNGKQLFFLFMAATAVSVVIFLSGVMVGRGVRAERGGVRESEALGNSPAALPGTSPTSPPSADAQPRPSLSMTAAPASAGADLTVVPPPPPGDDLDDVQPKASAKSAIPPPAKTEKVKPGKATAAATPTPPVSEGWVVQVAALKTRSEADAYAARLTPKGYSAYVVAPQAGTSIYRVRVGSFKTRREAQAIADKLKKEMDVTPWVTR